MKLIIGLGNPGKKYVQTRHNVGFLVVDALITQADNKWRGGNGPFQINQKLFLNGEVMVAKPTLFMNESGRAVKILVDQSRLSVQECLVVLDDVNLPVGVIRFRPSGSNGGHHGLESIIQALGTEDFPRLRIGVGSGDLSGRDLTEFVLGKFTKEELEIIGPQILRARDACLEWVRSGAACVMQRYNE